MVVWVELVVVMFASLLAQCLQSYPMFHFLLELTHVVDLVPLLEYSEALSQTSFDVGCQSFEVEWVVLV